MGGAIDEGPVRRNLTGPYGIRASGASLRDAEEKTYPCYTCRSDQPHRPPRDDRERGVIRKLANLQRPRAYVDDYWICGRTDYDCRNIRHAWQVKPFDPPQKMPEPE